MRSYDPNDEYDAKVLAEYNAEPWMVDLLKLNPEYVYWGPHEDYMTTKGEGWNAPVTVASWKEFEWKLDELNECVNFYFDIIRDSMECVSCGRSGYNHATREIADTFYDHGDFPSSSRPRGSTGRRWIDAITQDELEALWSEGRLCNYDKETQKWVPKPVTLEQVNRANSYGYRPGPGEDYFFLTHDGINRHILVETRAKRLGVYGRCKHCEGRGEVWTTDKAHVELVLWMIHPRKGASRGVEIKLVKREDLPGVFKWLRNAAERNTARFSAVINL